MIMYPKIFQLCGNLLAGHWLKLSSCIKGLNLRTSSLSNFFSRLQGLEMSRLKFTFGTKYLRMDQVMAVFHKFNSVHS